MSSELERLTAQSRHIDDVVAEDRIWLSLRSFRPSPSKSPLATIFQLGSTAFATAPLLLAKPPSDRARHWPISPELWRRRMSAQTSPL